MSYVKWDQSYSVKVQILDEQHKKLFVLIDEYYTAIASNRGKESLAGVLKGLIDYTRYHFGEEEKLMLQHGYPGLAEQKIQHAKFVGTVQVFQARVDEGKMLLSVEVSGFLKDWLAAHIKAKDCQYSEFFNGKGIQ